MLLGLAACSGGESSDGATDEPAGATGTWEDIRPAPIAGRTPAATAWTGKEMVVWGGFSTTELNDGAAYNPADDTWSQLPLSPLLGRQGHAMAWVGEKMVVWGGHGPHGEGEARNPNHGGGALLALRG